jgi:prevent-host-death family protein
VPHPRPGSFGERRADDMTRFAAGCIGVHCAGVLRGTDGAGCYEVLQMLRCALMKSRIITQRELRNQSAAILREVEAGRTIVVTRNGTPVGELRPIRRRRFVPRAAIADAAARAPRIDGDRFRADLDAVINPHIND